MFFDLMMKIPLDAMYNKVFREKKQKKLPGQRYGCPDK